MLFAEQIPTQTIEHNDHNAAHGMFFLKFLASSSMSPRRNHRARPADVGDNARLVAQNADIAGDLSVHWVARKVW